MNEHKRARVDHVRSLLDAGRAELPPADAECRVLSVIEPRADAEEPSGGVRGSGKRRTRRRVGLAPSEPLPLLEDSRPWRMTVNAFCALPDYFAVSEWAQRLLDGRGDLADAEAAMDILYPRLAEQVGNAQAIEHDEQRFHVLGLR